MKTRSFFRTLSLIVISAITAIACEGIIEEPGHYNPTPPDPGPQTPSYTITVTPNGTVNIPAEGGVKEFTIKTNAPYYGYSFPKRDWMKGSIDSDRMVVVINFTANDSGAERSNEVTFYGREKDTEEYAITQKVTVVQAAKKTDNPGGGTDNPGGNAISVNIDFGDASLSAQGCEVLTAMGSYAAGSSSASINMLESTEVPQIAMLCNQSGEVLMVSRDLYSSGAGITLDVRSSALAYVTLHPLFGLVQGKNGFGQLKEAIVGAPSFASFEQKVASVIKSGKPLFDPSNTNLNQALDKLLDEVFYSQEKPTKATNLAGLQGEGPLKITVDQKQVAVYPYYLSPMYSGSIVDPSNKKIAVFNIPAGTSYGITDVFYRTNVKYGTPETIDFTGMREGEYRFQFSRDTDEARLDYITNCLCDQLDVLGAAPSDDPANFKDALKDFVLSKGSWAAASYADGSTSEQERAELVYSLVVDFFSSNLALKFGVSEGFQSLAKGLGSLNKVYYGLRGSANGMSRLYFYASCPHEIKFCLCHTGNLPLYSCSYVSLQALSGDGQEGHTGEMLAKELAVRVVVGNNDNPPDHFLVHFRVTSGGGSVAENLISTDANLEARTFWTLGPDGEEQTVSVEVLDPASKGVISKNTIVFTARNMDFTRDVPAELQGIWRAQTSENPHKKPIKITLNKHSASFEDPDNPQRNKTDMPVWVDPISEDGRIKYYDIYLADENNTLFLGHVKLSRNSTLGTVMDVQNVWNYYQNKRFILQEAMGEIYFVSLLCEFTNGVGQYGRISMQASTYTDGNVLSVQGPKVTITGTGEYAGEELSFYIEHDSDGGYVVKDFHYAYNYSYVYDSSTIPPTMEEVSIEASVDIMPLINTYSGSAWFDADEKSTISYSKRSQLFPEDSAYFTKQQGEPTGNNIFSIEIHYSLF